MQDWLPCLAYFLNVSRMLPISTRLSLKALIGDFHRNSYQCYKLTNQFKRSKMSLKNEPSGQKCDGGTPQERNHEIVSWKKHLRKQRHPQTKTRKTRANLVPRKTRNSTNAKLERNSNRQRRLQPPLVRKMPSSAQDRGFKKDGKFDKNSKNLKKSKRTGFYSENTYRQRETHNDWNFSSHITSFSEKWKRKMKKRRTHRTSKLPKTNLQNNSGDTSSKQRLDNNNTVLRKLRRKQSRETDQQNRPAKPTGETGE